jgi:hypothetical protein
MCDILCVSDRQDLVDSEDLKDLSASNFMCCKTGKT